MKKKVAIIGTGDLAKHIAHYVTQDHQYDVAGYYDDFTSVGEVVDGYFVLGKLDDLVKSYSQKVFDAIIIAVGYSRMTYRRSVFQRFDGNIPFATFIHSTSYVDPTAVIKPGCVIFPRCVIDKKVIIEKNVFLNINNCISHDTHIEAHTCISPGSTIAGFVNLGQMCNIGINTTIIDNISICDDVRTGGGCVITENITDPGIYVGIPARKIYKHD